MAVSNPPLAAFHPIVADWFERAFATPTPAQTLGWPPIAAGRHTLIVAPTGSGKTLAAFLWGLNSLVTRRLAGDASGRLLYISPLKALNYDVERNLRGPLAGLADAAGRVGQTLPEIAVAVRTGDTPQRERAQMLRHPPDILITTPESLYLLLTSRGTEVLADVDQVIIDEIHAVAATKRGAHLALSLERLEHETGRAVQRIGLSATQRPLDEIARFLGGRAENGEPRDVAIVDAGRVKEMDLQVIVPVDDLREMANPGAPPTADDLALAGGENRQRSIWPAMYPAILELVKAHRSTIVFVNNRRLAERLALRLNELAEDDIARAHHGSLAREQRTIIEEQLKAGELPCLVATSSLELGIDMGAVDLVIQVESPRSVARGIQRVGRAGHQVGEASRGRIFPKYRGDLLECAAVVARMKTGDIETTRVPRLPLDVLAQQIVATVSDDADWTVDALHTLVRRAEPFSELTRDQLEGVLDMLAGRYPSDEFAELRPRIVWDRVTGSLRARDGARRLAIANAGTIPDRGLYSVVMVGDGARVGELDEEMVYEARSGQTFLLGASAWRIEEITRDRVIVSPAPGALAAIPFWKGDGAGRPVELGRAVGRLARELVAQSQKGALKRLREESSFDARAASNLLTYLADQADATGTVPSDTTIVVERFRDEIGDWRLCVLTPFGAPVHAPWAMAIQARHRERSGQEAHVIWSDDGIAIHIPEADDAPGADLALIDPDELEDLVIGELGSTALFGSRFRENAARALLIPRRRPGQRTPLWQQRLKASSLLQVARQYGTFPIILETYRECLNDWLDLGATRDILRGLQSREIALVEVETPTASPFAGSLLFEYVAAYMYDDDTPVAERRAAALALDRDLLRELLGQEELRELIDADALDELEAVLQGRAQGRQARDADGLHDLLRRLGDLNLAEIAERVTEPASVAEWLDVLRRERRAVTIHLAGEERIIAAEDAGRYRDGLGVMPPSGLPAAFLETVDGALDGLLARYARTNGPFLSGQVMERFNLPKDAVERTLATLEARGGLVRGELRPGGSGREWCDTEVLRRLRRASLAVLRREVEPVDAAALARFLPSWHGIDRTRSERGEDAVRHTIGVLQGLALPLAQWESETLPRRVAGYVPAWLDQLLAAGDVIWSGAGAMGQGGGRVALYVRDEATLFGPPTADPVPEDETAAAIVAALAAGAGFWDDILGALDTPVDEIYRALWELVWAGAVTNDSWLALRSPRHAPRPLAATRPRFGRRGLGVPRTPPSVTGRWSLLAPRFARLPPDADRRRALAEVLLERHGIVTRAGVLADSVPSGFSRVYGDLTDLETLGRARRGYFVEGLGGAQFALPGAVERLRELREPPNGPSEVLVIGASDPAQPYGGVIPWPPTGGRSPSRVFGAQVVLVDGYPVLYLERGGRAIRTLSTDTAPLALAVSALAGWVGDAARRRLRVGRVDGASVFGSPLVALLLESGFRQGAATVDLGR